MDTKKRKIRFNIIDLILAAAILITAGFLVKTYIIDEAGPAASKKAELRYVVRTDMLSEDLADNIKEGDTVYDLPTGSPIGTVASCDIRDATHSGTATDGTQVISPITGYRVLYITIDALADGQGGEFTVENVPISAGLKYELTFRDLYCTGTCISVETPD